MTDYEEIVIIVGHVEDLLSQVESVTKNGLDLSSHKSIEGVM